MNWLLEHGGCQEVVCSEFALFCRRLKITNPKNGGLRGARRDATTGDRRFVVRMDRVAYRVTLRVRFTCCLNFSLPSEAKEWTQYTHKLKRAPPPPPPPNTHTGLERTQPSAIRIAQKHGCQHRHKEGIEDVRTSLRLALHRKREKKVGRSVV